MLSCFQRLFTVLCFAAVSLGMVQRAVSEPRPRFAGSYQLTNVVESGAEVHFTVKFTLLNPNNNDVKGGILVLKDSQPHSELIGKVAEIDLLPHQGEKSVSEDFTVSAAEYARWQQGHYPRFDFLVPGADGARDIPVLARPIVQPLVKAN